MHAMATPSAAVVATLAVLSVACGNPTTESGTTAAKAPAAASSPASRSPMTITDHYEPQIDPSKFSTTIDNPYLPLIPGTRIVYDADTAQGKQRTTTEVTRDTKVVMGVRTVVVHDVVATDGQVTEDTFDWYAQDRDGNVWYFGEDTKEFDGGAVATTGSFEAGVAGALPGIVMLGHPQVGDAYRQEFAKGIAEDTGQVVSLAGSETTPLTGPVSALVVTKDADLLDPNSPPENKYYARGVGLILTVQTAGPPDREQAVSVEKF